MPVHRVAPADVETTLLTIERKHFEKVVAVAADADHLLIFTTLDERRLERLRSAVLSANEARRIVEGES